MKRTLLLICLLLGGIADVSGRTMTSSEPLPQMQLSEGDAAMKPLFIKLTQEVTRKDWQAVLVTAQEITSHPEVDRNGMFYPTACYLEVASSYQLCDYETVVKRASEVISKRDIKASGTRQGVRPREAATFEGYVYFFLMDSYIRQSEQNPALQERALQVFEEYVARYPDSAVSDCAAATSVCSTAIRLRVNRALADKKVDELDAAQKCFDYWRKHGITWDGQYEAAEQLVADARQKLQSEK